MEEKNLVARPDAAPVLIAVIESPSKLATKEPVFESKTKTEVIGYENLQRCETKFKNSPKEETVYSYSTITFILDGKEQTIEFQKLQ